MEKFIADYRKRFIDLCRSIIVTESQGHIMPVTKGIQKVCSLISAQAKKGGKIIFIGNGGSAAIASHMALDFWKNGAIAATAFNDISLLTSLANDLGYEYVFSEPIRFFASSRDLLIAISSSGRSENILNGVVAAEKKGCRIATLSGFNKDNPLRKKGDYNFYVSCDKYGPVEVLHQYLCHFILDVLIAQRKGKTLRPKNNSFRRDIEG